jgi:hypothetical protein
MFSLIHLVHNKGVHLFTQSTANVFTYVLSSQQMYLLIHTVHNKCMHFFTQFTTFIHSVHKKCINLFTPFTTNVSKWNL